MKAYNDRRRMVLYSEGVDVDGIPQLAIALIPIKYERQFNERVYENGGMLTKTQYIMWYNEVVDENT